MNTGRLDFGLDRFSGLYLWATFIIVFGIWKPDLFLTGNTAHSIGSSQAIGAMLAIAVVVALSAGAYDLSLGAVINVSAIIVTALLNTKGWGIWQSILAAVGASAAIGAVNGFLVVKAKISSFIATLGMATVVAAIQTMVSGGGQPLPPKSETWNKLTSTEVFGFQIVVLYLIVLAFVVWWGLEHTPPGRYLYAIGQNSEAARLTGIKTGTWTWVSLIASSTIAGIAGVLYASLSGPSLTFGSSLLLPAFAAAFLGSTQLKPGTVNVWGAVLAVYVLATGVKGLQFVTSAQWLNDMFNGLALILAVSFAVWRQRRALLKPRRDDEASLAHHSDGPTPQTPVAVPAEQA